MAADMIFTQEAIRCQSAFMSGRRSSTVAEFDDSGCPGVIRAAVLENAGMRLAAWQGNDVCFLFMLVAKPFAVFVLCTGLRLLMSP
jgi:hypothetical protein